MKRKLFFVLAVVTALAITGINYASTQATKTVTVSSTGFADVTQAVAGAGNYGTVDFSSWQPAVNTSGTTGSGDLYIIDRSAGATGDIYGTLYLSNAAALANDYSYLNLKINIYGKNTEDTVWTDVLSEPSVLTLANGYVSFTINDTYDLYSISIDSGSFYCISTATTDGSSLSPEYYVEIR
ncbi:MAG TPA: hypothetical protein VFK44_10300 [Bacillales bacterium]|nr:hypothetical protein [Bacillales bacterium]